MQQDIKPGEQIAIALDVAASELSMMKVLYVLKSENRELTSQQNLQHIMLICVRKYPIVSIEDGLSEDDWDGWKEIIPKYLEIKYRLVGDDLICNQCGYFNRGD